MVKRLFDDFHTDGASPVAIYGTKAGGISLAKSLTSLKVKQFRLEAFITDGKEMADVKLLGKKVYLNQQGIADKMKANNSISIRITGWCDPIGSQDVNRRISLLRAKTIMNALEMLQIPTERIEIVGGGIKHDAPNNTEARITTIEEIYHK